MASNGASASASGNGSYKDIYELLEKLCSSLVSPGGEYRDVLQIATHHITNCPSSIGTTYALNESNLLNKIAQVLSSSQAVNGSSNGSSSASAASQETSKLFLSSYEQLKASIDTHQRTALLAFLYHMSNTGHSIGSSFDEPNRQHMRQPSTVGITGLPNSSRLVSSQSILSNRSQSVSDSSIQTHFLRQTDSRTSTNSESSTHLRNKMIITTNNSSNVVCPSTTSFSGSVVSAAVTFSESDPNDLVQNSIYSFTGVEGKYLRKDLLSGRFKLDPREKNLSVVEAGMLLRLSEIGYYHDLVKSYSDEKKGVSALGLMGQGLVSAYRDELTKYYGMVAMLQEQFRNHREMERNRSMIHSQRENFTLLRLLIWYVEPLQRLQWLAKIGDACKQQKGGALASIIHEFMNNGNPMVKALAKKLLLAVCKPFLYMLSQWLLEGEIIDPHGEFFVECVPEVGPDRLWHDKYRLRSEMLPCFITEDMAHKILVTGKSINFLREVCKDKQPVKGREDLLNCIKENAEHIFSYVADTKLHTTIDAIYLNTSKRVVDISKGPHKLLEHLQAMRRFLLLGQGDFIGILMENLKTELDKPAKELYSHDLSSIMDIAIRSSNAQFEDPEILNHLDVRLMAPCEGDTGWDILSLQYTVQGPLSTMLEPSMGIYQILFKPLWRLKHMEFVLSSKVWKDQKCYAKRFQGLSNELRSILSRLHLYTSEMIHLIFQVQYYILFEVIECTWAEMQEHVQAAKTLDDILQSHNDCLNEIKCRAFLDKNSTELGQNLEKVYESIMLLEQWQDKFYTICFKEQEARNEFQRQISESESTGKFGVTAEQQLERDQERKIFEQTVISCQKSLDNIGANYESAVRCFLLALNSSNDCNMQLFGVRLDFNEYYKKRDQRISVPLTFEHMRMSNVQYNPCKSMLCSRVSTTNMN